MFKSREKRQLASIQEVINNHSQGIYKRIDENRELMELLVRDGGPGFLERNSWVVSWLESQDAFLEALRKVAGLSVNKPGSPMEGYPRPRPYLAVDLSMQTEVSHAQDGVAPGVNIHTDEPKDDADEFARLKEKRKQLYAIEHACRESNGAIGGPRFNFAAVSGSTAFLAVLALLWSTRLPGWSVFLCSVTACISVFFLTYRHSTRPLEWDGLIDKLLAGYDPIDMESYRRLQTDIGENGYIDQWRVRDWVGAERTAIRIERHGVTVPYDFLRKIV
ncbi:conserved protein of unknown function [Acidithiobacillus ferrivorans]|uniref:Uncharacterized protein n=1 Tax=Acidithiobacillus ferrivorans TaxID=160808 RepID=A0A060UPZ8_9PROT|nr:hypothetical protein [Acidithiobacillus ferrivorans]CDQ10475.1 conserved hypothetical protein [Acidithiobacillus ferrivorans]SMH64503.1 conserved protein of unknown function [Acidithiobacillus ferrivorans]